MMILSENEIKNLDGLNDQDVNERILKNGYNELPSAKKRCVIKIIFEVFREPMFLLLVSCGVLYLLLGDLQEALMLLGFVFVVMGITIYQESKTENALKALQDLTSPRALVIRNKEQKRIAGREVVADDIIIINEGDRVPADAVLLWSRNLSVDESLLTGESVPVRKITQNEPDISNKKPGGDDQPFIFSGTLVVAGQAVAKIISTGLETEIGRIGLALESIEEKSTPLQVETGKLVKNIFIIAIILCFTLVIIYGFTRGKWLEAILSGITLAMAMLPEEFPVVLTIFLALGAWRISKKNVLTRRISAVETLGSATVLCVDKTGTLTENKMSVRKIFCNEKIYDVDLSKNSDLPEDYHEIIEYAILASKKDPFDPMEKALQEVGFKMLHDTEHLHKDWPMIEEYPLSKEMLALSHVWKNSSEEQLVVSAKGAPEAVMDLCHLNVDQIKLISEKINDFAGRGLRVLGVAKAIFKSEVLPKSQHDFNFSFLGLIGLEDPVRPSVLQAVRECYDAGIRVVMITGDYPSTASNIAGQIGLENSFDVITGAELKSLSDNELKEKIKKVNVFARVVPEQKLLLVNAFKANNEIVAMTGDGVNDAPALKSAHIGVAMGERGTDVARESSSIVLIKDDFNSIVSAVRMGRRIYENLRKAMAYIISVHIPIAGISLIPVLLNWPVILYPLHIVFMELIIDPACSIVFEQEKEEAAIMKRPPRKQNAPMFGKTVVALSVLQGITALLFVISVYKMALISGQSLNEARTISFITLIISNIGLILSNRSWHESIFKTFKNKNNALIWVIGGALFFLSAVTYLPFLQKMFKFSFMHLIDIIIAIASGILSILSFEVIKYFFRKKLL